MKVRVFEIRGVHLFQYDGSVPPSLTQTYNESEDRYEVSKSELLDNLPVPYEIVDDIDSYRVQFERNPPERVARAALLTEQGPMTTTVLCPDKESRKLAVEAGGKVVG